QQKRREIVVQIGRGTIQYSRGTAREVKYARARTRFEARQSLPHDVAAEADVVRPLRPRRIRRELLLPVLADHRTLAPAAPRVPHRRETVHADLRPAAVQAIRTVRPR